MHISCLTLSLSQLQISQQKRFPSLNLPSDPLFCKVNEDATFLGMESFSQHPVLGLFTLKLPTRKTGSPGDPSHVEVLGSTLLTYCRKSSSFSFQRSHKSSSTIVAQFPWSRFLRIPFEYLTFCNSKTRSSNDQTIIV